jgi:HK97 gp10 family phage protein
MANSFDGLSAKLAQLGAAIKSEVSIAGAAAMAVVIYDEVRLNADRHVKTGKLRDSIYRVYSKRKSVNARQVYQISWNKKKAPHGHLLEFGTSRSPAYPFIRPSVSRSGDAVKAGMARMAAAMKKIGGSR